MRAESPKRTDPSSCYQARQGGPGGFFFFDPSPSSYPHHMDEEILEPCAWCGDEEGVFAFIIESKGKKSDVSLGAECWYRAIVASIGKPKRVNIQAYRPKPKGDVN